jgi:hypothetical protein
LADVLNFSSVLMSLFTMFQLSAQSNWSIVMDATAKQAGNRAYVFFYTYRLVMTLFVVPILMSFIMNSFVSAVVKKDRRFRTKQEEQANRDMVQGMTMDFDDNTGINAERAALESISKYDPNMKQLPEEEFRVGGDKSRSSTTSASARDTISSQNPKDVPPRGSLFHNIIGVLPSITFGSQPLRAARQKPNERYSISSKSKDLSGPSMLSLWAGDEAPTTGQARETIKRNSMKGGSLDDDDDGSLSRQTFASNIRTPRASFMNRQGSPGSGGASENFSTNAALEARVAALEVELENERLKNLPDVPDDGEGEEEEEAEPRKK